MKATPAETTQKHLAELQDTNPKVRLLAAIALQREGGYLEQILPVLVNDITAVDEELLDDWQWRLKRIKRPALIALANKALERAIPTEFRILVVRTIATEFYQDHSAAAEAMAQLLPEDSDLSRWAAVILALGGRQIHAHDRFLQALRSEDEQLVKTAVYALHNFAGRSADEVARVKAAWLPCLLHPSYDVRANCCMFTKIDLDAADLNRLNLSEDDPIEAVISALAKMKSPPLEALDLLIRGLDSESDDTRNSDAPGALIRLGTAAIQPLIDLSLDENVAGHVRYGALLILGKSKSLPSAFIDQLQKLLSNRDLLSQYAAIALAEQGIANPAVIQNLVMAMDEEPRHVKECLRRLPTDQTVPVLIEHLERCTDEDKPSFVMFLGEIGGRSPLAAKAIVKQFATASDYTLRNQLSNALKYCEELAAAPAIEALASYEQDEQILWLLDGLHFVGRFAIATLPSLLPYLEHANPKIVFAAAATIARLDPQQPGIVQPLLARLSANSSDRYETMNTIEGMEFYAAPYIDRLIQLLDDDEYSERATQTLGRIGPTAAPAIPKLAEIMRGSNSSSSVIEALGRIANPAALPHLLAALDDENKVEYVLQALLWMKDYLPLAMPRLSKLLESPYRLIALGYFARYGKVTESAATKLIAMVDDPDPEIRLAAIRAVSEFQLALPRLLELATSADLAIQKAALEALGGTRSTQAIPLLLEALQSNTHEIMAAGIRGFSKYGTHAPEEFLDFLQERFSFNTSSSLDWEILNAWNELGPAASKAVPIIQSLLTQKDFSEQAFLALKSIGTAAVRALPELEKLLANSRYRAIARYTIWDISPERARELGLIYFK